MKAANVARAIRDMFANGSAYTSINKALGGKYEMFYGEPLSWDAFLKLINLSSMEEYYAAFKENKARTREEYGNKWKSRGTEIASRLNVKSIDELDTLLRELHSSGIPYERIRKGLLRDYVRLYQSEFSHMDFLKIVERDLEDDVRAEREALKEKISEMFEDGDSFTDIRSKIEKEHPSIYPTGFTFDHFLEATSIESIQYRKLRQKYYSRRRARNKEGSLGERLNAKDEYGKSFRSARERVLTQSLGRCIFCGEDAEEVHHLLGLEKGHNSRYLLPVCSSHHRAFHSRRYVTNSRPIMQMALIISELYPRLYITVKAGRWLNGQYTSFPIVTCMDGKARLLVDKGHLENYRRYFLEISENSFDMEVWRPTP